MASNIPFAKKYYLHTKTANHAPFIFYFSIFSTRSFIHILSTAKPLHSIGKPKLIVQVVVSQMRFDYLNRYWESLAIMDLNYLLTKGLTAEMPVTTTCSPRHTLGWPPLPPGANPSVHGIIPTSGITAIQETRLKPPPTKRLTRLGVVFSGG